jgi:mannose PTS system EIIA component
LPMLVRAVCYRTTPLQTLAEKSLQGGSKGIQELDASTPVNPCALASRAAAAASTLAGACATACMPAKVA